MNEWEGKVSECNFDKFKNYYAFRDKVFRVDKYDRNA